MNRPRGPGWAALGRAQHEKEDSGSQHEKQGAVPECDADPYPSISKITSLGHTKCSRRNHVPGKSFSSVVCSSVEFPLLVGCKIQNDNSVSKRRDGQIIKEPAVTPVKMLQDIHTWADENLIGDILAAVKNDVDRASELLKAMVSPRSKLEEATPFGPGSSTVGQPFENDKCSKESYFTENKLSDGDVEVSKRMFFVPSEPEWEEDDIYVRQRKDALRMMRAASQHSRVASNAFLRGDHLSAHQYSLRAREEWIAAENLNTKAAEEILCIRNSDNDMSKIDLHGLHASEAVRALREHLHKIESLIVKRLPSSDELAKLEAGILRSSSCESISGWLMNEKEKKEHLPQARPTVLHVITGKGNHSRGQAALPTAIRSFLIENGYRFDDAREGVIAVRLKFRQKRS